MKIIRLNKESIENEVTEVPSEVTLNPIEADQAIEIANNNPTTSELDSSTSYDNVNKIASDIDDNFLTIDEIQSATKSIKAAIGQDEDLPVRIMRNTEALKIAYSKLGIKPLTISREDIENNPAEVLKVLEDETQGIQSKANNDTWATVKEDCANIVKLIDASVDAIANRTSDKDRALELLKSGKISKHSIDLTNVLEYVGSLRYFLTKEDNSLFNLASIMADLLSIDSPKLTSTDNTILAGINKLDPESIKAAREHILSAIESDPLNAKLKSLVAIRTDLPDYPLYGKLTGLNKIKVMSNNTCKEVTVDNTEVTFNITDDTTAKEAFVEGANEALANFETRFKNLFILYKKKYEILEEIVKPLAYDLVSEQDQTKIEELTEVLNLIRYYYIGFVKNRIVDKVNAYNGLLDTVVLTFDPKEDSSTETTVEEPVKEEEPSKSEDSDPETIEDDSTVEPKEESTEEESK